MYDMGNTSVYFLTPSQRYERDQHPVMMSLVFYMFQSILNIFVCLLFLVGKINYFHGWGEPPSPQFAENSAKIINLIFEPLPKHHRKIPEIYWGGGTTPSIFLLKASLITPTVLHKITFTLTFSIRVYQCVFVFVVFLGL